MALTSGTKLGPYEIQSPLGAGGMGEVYRARDSRLDRIVAVKVLPSHLSDNADLKQRFDREARAISSLQHAHICALFDVGHENGVDYLVMEYLEGDTLASRLLRGPLPLDQVLRVAIEIASALEKAHRSGIIHRDLKPGNIMLTKAGAKLMDFGLAKSRVNALSGAGSSIGPLTPSTPTMNLGSLTAAAPPLTQKGSIVGTFQYMAPEVLQGAEADARSDIFSFGCALYEMTTGRRAFDGKSQVGVLAAILEKEPDPISSTQPLTPPSLDRLIRICLAKDPDERWQSVHDLKVQLEAIAEMGSKAGVPAVIADSRQHRKHLLTGLGIAGWVLALAGLFSALFYLHRWSEERTPVRADIDSPVGAEMAFNLAGGVAISPDNHKLTFPAKTVNSTQLWVRDLESGKSWPLAGTDDAQFPFWSADSRSIGFFAGAKLRSVAAVGGPVQAICDAPSGRGGSWSQTGFIVFTPNIEESLYKVPEAGGTPTAVTQLGKQGFTHRNPQFLPDGKHFLFTHRDLGAENGDLYVGSLDGGDPTPVVQRASNGAYSQGYLLYLRDRNLLAQRFDTGSFKTSGNPIPIAQNIEYWGPKDLGNFSVSPSGTLLYRVADVSQSRFAWLKLPGKETEEFGDPIIGLEALGVIPSTRVSTDGKKISFVKRDPTAPTPELWVFETEHKTFTREASNDSGIIYSAFSPDASKIAIAVSGGNTSTLRIKNLSTGTEEPIEIGKTRMIFVDSWTPDGKYLIMMAQDPKTLFDLYAQPVEGGKAIPLLTQSYNEYQGKVSPNGKWMAYLSNESGRPEIYVTDFPAAHAKLQISTDGASWHAWSQDGKHLYFANGNKLSASDIRNPETMEFSSAQLITTLDGVQPVAFNADGRLLVLKPVGDSRTEPLHMILHFPQTLENQ